MTGSVRVDFLSDIRGIDHAEWQRLLPRGGSHVVFLTPEWQRTWWDVYGRGKLLLGVARKDGDIVAIAPMFADPDGMVYLVGSGGCGSDYLDFVGDISNPATLDELLSSAAEQVPEFSGFRFYLVHKHSPTSQYLSGAASRLGLTLSGEDEIAAPLLDLSDAGAAESAVNKKSLRRHERHFEKSGGLTVTEVSRCDDILPHLDQFFAQHVARWAGTPYPSLFLNEAHRRFYRQLTIDASAAGWLRFTRVEWQNRLIAAHFGFCFNGNYFWYKPSFAIDLARQSPGEVLLRRLLVSAVKAGAHTFDFGIGDETFKKRFATATPLVKTWGLYARGRRTD